MSKYVLEIQNCYFDKLKIAIRQYHKQIETVRELNTAIMETVSHRYAIPKDLADCVVKIGIVNNTIWLNIDDKYIEELNAYIGEVFGLHRLMQS